MKNVPHIGRKQSRPPELHPSNMERKSKLLSTEGTELNLTFHSFARNRIFRNCLFHTLQRVSAVGRNLARHSSSLDDVHSSYSFLQPPTLLYPAKENKNTPSFFNEKKGRGINEKEEKVKLNGG